MLYPTHYLPFNGNGQTLIPITKANSRIKNGKLEIGHQLETGSKIYWNTNENLYFVKGKLWLADIRDNVKIDIAEYSQEWYNSLPETFEIN